MELNSSSRPPTNVTPPTNATLMFVPTNYTLPTGCNFDSSDNMTVCCSGASAGSGDNSTNTTGTQASCWTFDELNTFWTDQNIQDICTEIMNSMTTCAGNSTIP